jgi:hypothetical protein
MASKNDKAMVSGVAAILRKVKSPTNRKAIAKDMVSQFKREKVEFSKDSFLKRAKSK